MKKYDNSAVKRKIMPILLFLGMLLTSMPQGNLQAAAPLAPSRAPAAKTVTLYAQADAMVASGSPDANYGAGSLGVTQDSQSYIWFDLSSIPANAVIDSATLMLMPADIMGTGPHSIGVGAVQNAWDESTVTWNTKPGVTTPGVFTSVGDYTWQSWDVTALVQAWHAGSANNYGFALLTNAPGVSFDSKETVPAPRLVVVGSLPPEDDPDQPVPAGKPFSDLGDAPDSSNNHGQNNTAYPGGVLGQFPTVYQGTPAGQPAGPLHTNLSMEAILGNNITREQDADGGADADGVNNILRNPPAGSGPVADTADNDRADDGWRNRNVPILDCERTTLVVKVHKAPNAQLDRMYLNVWFDGNQDGDWEDTGICQFEDGQQARSYEWIIQDRLVDLSAIPAGATQNVTVTTVLVHNPAPNPKAKNAHWMRFTLSEQKAPRNPATNLADGRGPNPNATPKAYAFGETEDVLYRPDPAGQPGTLTFQKAVVTQSTPVAFADTVTYTIRLKHTGGTEPIRAEIRDRLTYPQHVFPQVVGSLRKYVNVTELSPGVNPLNARFAYLRPTGAAHPEQAIRWKGTLAPDAEVELSFLVQVTPICQTGQSTVTITNTATLHKPDGTKVDEQSVNFEAACPGYSLDDIQVNQEVITDGDSGSVGTAQADAANIMFETVHPKWQGTFTNNAKQTIDVGFSLNFEEIKVTGAAVNLTEAACKVITLQPGETRTLEQPLDIIGILVGLAQDEIPADAAKEIDLRSRLRYAVLPVGKAADCTILDNLPPEQVAEHQLPFKFRPWDLGDAPDSTNHAAAPMTAYPGVPANFPTVFDVTTGAPEGPRHARPRPFHLGKRVEFEPDADLGAAPRNIDPTSNTPNRDRYDDGVNLGAINFQDCQTTTFQARVYISAAGQAALLAKGFKTAYLNTWVDSNRDGDWADVAQCPNGTAPEHIVIDQPVDIASLTPGLNTIAVATTGPVSWPADMAQKPAWLRVMLSEEKSVKLAGQAYGDGRGPATGYRTGETEDYLWRPKDQGADPVVELDFHWAPIPVESSAKPARKVILRIQYANHGSEPLVDSSLFITVPVALQNATLLNVVSVPNLGPLDASSPIMVALGTLAPGQQGTIVYSWKVEESENVTGAAVDFTYTEIEWTVIARTQGRQPNGVIARNENSATLGISRSMPNILGFTPSGGSVPAPNVTTSRNTLDVMGTAEPNSTLLLTVEGLGSSTNRSTLQQFTVPVGPDGNWSYGLTAQIDGLYRVWAAYSDQAAPASSTASRLQNAIQHESRKFVVDTTLPIDPLSMVVSDDQGNRWTPDTLNFNTGMPPAIFVPGRTYAITIKQTPGQEGARLSLDFLSPFHSTLFEDIGGGVLQWTGCLTCTRSTNVGTGTAGYALVIDNNGEETTLEGEYSTTQLGRVSDAQTGQPISGASVRLLAQTPVSDTVGSAAVYDTWSSDGGQPNPQTTGGDGGYLFVPPAGSYRVQVSAPGYQPYTGDNINVAAGDAVAQAIALVPVVSATPDVVVEISDGGFEPGILTVPPGTTIRWVNVDTSEHSVSASASSRAVNGFDSGLLGPGESFVLTVSEAGSYTLADARDPFNQGSLIVDPSAPPVGTQYIYLPAVMR